MNLEHLKEEIKKEEGYKLEVYIDTVTPLVAMVIK